MTEWERGTALDGMKYELMDVLRKYLFKPSDRIKTIECKQILNGWKTRIPECETASIRSVKSGLNIRFKKSLEIETDSGERYTIDTMKLRCS